MFNLLANIFGYVLNFIYNLVQNYGVAIIIFTVLLRLCMIPMNVKQQKTMKKSAKLQVQVKELQEKYSNDPTKLNQEMMDLYKQENMSPFSGCLSSIVQMIVIISIFYLVSKPLTYMLHVDSDLIDSYVTEIKEESGEDTLNYQEIAVIREKADEDDTVYINMEFLGLDLSSVPTQNASDWRVFIIPVLYVCTSIISMKITTSMQNANNKKDEKGEEKPKSEEEEAMASMNKSMMYMMPIMAVSISLIAPLGLALYWFVGNLIMILERVIMNKFIKEKDEPAEA